MSSDDSDRKRPGFFRRLFGGTAEVPVDPVEAAPVLPAAEPAAPPSEPPAATPVLPPVAELSPAAEKPPARAESLSTEAEELAAAVELVERTALAGPVETAVTPADLKGAFEIASEPPRPLGSDPSPGEPEAPEGGWWSRLRKGLSRSSNQLGQGLTGIFTKRRLELSTVEDLEDLLIQADLGVATALKVVDLVRDGRFTKGVGAEDVQAIIAAEVEAVLAPVAKPLVPEGKHPFVVLVVGVNGSGKTTTIGKLAQKYTREGKSVMLAAGDTFRAAAVEQLKVWGARIGVPVLAREAGADAAGLAFDAIKEAQAKAVDVLLIDTAGRLQNRAELMDELAKVLRVIRKLDDAAPHAVLLVLDATVGQNAMSQVEIFGKVAGVTGLVMTKLDGTARGGILVAIAEKFRLPVHFIGVGEGVEDLEPFAARDFARAIAGLER
ncbi:signal recognition particle-docking protein FtsY [Lichenihabitans sp. Uapishka_5]|uniref:signal recognition particle-docking protein FtsY n=1 Tax=Lichenihabitans sp. Uapishka_5 TaxID=3037302 RepID=UPI0029E80B22|nr:signal recognition particle-docking protein FtsY [Lichenihabitans sp. Uapishka_5]MDX7953317.1 signal recognition particle-docking protein FtsY [Lichenihabitans sp. Uapishka_5]